MFESVKSWFNALSKSAKIGVIAALVTTGSVASAAIAEETPSSTPPAKVETSIALCTSSKTTKAATEAIPFDKTTVDDASAEKGKSYIKTPGVDGTKTTTYEVTTYAPTGCKPDDKQLVKEEVTTEPVTEVTANGTYVTPPKSAPSCDPNYSGACVPVASDVDCGGGSGDGPAYLYGTATVVGSDIYGLDRDRDGLACE